MNKPSISRKMLCISHGTAMNKMSSDTPFFRPNWNECEQFTIPSIISNFPSWPLNETIWNYILYLSSLFQSVLNPINSNAFFYFVVYNYKRQPKYLYSYIIKLKLCQDFWFSNSNRTFLHRSWCSIKTKWPLNQFKNDITRDSNWFRR